MITITTSGSSIIFEFDDNQHYLQNGTIEVPVNSLLLVTDSSNMATFKKAATNDIFLSALYSELGMTKEELIAFYEENMVGSTGIDSGTVQTMIDGSISGKADTSAVTDSINAAVSGKVDTSVFETYSGSVETALSGKVDTSAITTSITSASTDSQVISAKAVHDQLDGLKLEQLTQSEYDDLVSGGTVDSSTIYFIVNNG